MTSPTFVAAWYEKFRDMPVIAGRSILAPMDGDIAKLHELRRTLLCRQELRSLTALPPDYLYYRTLVDTAIAPSTMDWPDPAGAQLDAWRAGR